MKSKLFLVFIIILVSCLNASQWKVNQEGKIRGALGSVDVEVMDLDLNNLEKELFVGSDSKLEKTNFFIYRFYQESYQIIESDNGLLEIFKSGRVYTKEVFVFHKVFMLMVFFLMLIASFLSLLGKEELWLVKFIYSLILVILMIILLHLLFLILSFPVFLDFFFWLMVFPFLILFSFLYFRKRNFASFLIYSYASSILFLLLA